MQVCSLIYLRQRVDNHQHCNPSSHPPKVPVCMVKCSPRSVWQSRAFWQSRGLPGLYTYHRQASCIHHVM